MRLHDRAEPLLRRALAIHEAAHGNNDPFVAEALENLAALLASRGQLNRAEPLFQRALAIYEASLGKNKPSSSALLRRLANVYRYQGLYNQAEPLLQRALAIHEATSHGKDSNTAGVVNDLALLRLAQRRRGEALPLFARAFNLSEERLRLEALDFSESRLESFLQSLRQDEERLYALLRSQVDDAGARHLALTAALLLKGRSAEEIAGTSRTIYRSLDTQDRHTFERLRDLRTQVAMLSLDGPGSRTPTEHQQRLQELTSQGDDLEADLARRSAPLRALNALPSPTDIVERVAAALPPEGALVEFIAYADKPLVPRPGAPVMKIPGQLRYLAMVLVPDGHTRALDLGPAAPIDSAVSRLHDALASGDAAYQGAAQRLYQLAFRPLLPLLGGVHRLFLAPDGQLGLVPFA
ncbi:MAG TPA: tetratricopeptide repeat protein, partial [Myxococcaceae bacterium]